MLIKDANEAPIINGTELAKFFRSIQSQPWKK